jgi:hypothetical protein
MSKTITRPRFSGSVRRVTNDSAPGSRYSRGLGTMRTRDDVLETNTTRGALALGRVWEGGMKPLEDFIVAAAEPIKGFTLNRVLGPEPIGNVLDLGAIRTGLENLTGMARNVADVLRKRGFKDEAEALQKGVSKRVQAVTRNCDLSTRGTNVAQRPTGDRHHGLMSNALRLPGNNGSNVSDAGKRMKEAVRKLWEPEVT